MPRILFVTHDGRPVEFDAPVGDSLMLAATRNGVPGIVAECGGNCTCATCHVYVRDEYLGLVGPPNDLEEDMLDLAVSERRPGSRLSCQIRVTEALEGMEADIPDRQP